MSSRWSHIRSQSSWVLSVSSIMACSRRLNLGSNLTSSSKTRTFWRSRSTTWRWQNTNTGVKMKACHECCSPWFLAIVFCGDCFFKTKKLSHLNSLLVFPRFTVAINDAVSVCLFFGQSWVRLTAYSHTTLSTPERVWSQKLSGVRSG